ncbi:MAG: NAD(P)-binding domain-containing protein [Alphaproteobacteria bacterium]|nr:NAD(P)-binding domain-containing protein [Alphaproteobacteria bacterium]
MAEHEAWQYPIKTVGVIGLGKVGRSICHRLAGQGRQSGFKQVAGFDLDKSVLEDLSEAAIAPSKSMAHLVDKVDLVLLCPPGSGPGSSNIGKIARSHEGLLDCVRQGQIIVDHSWSSLELTRQLATAFTARGAAFLDAPIGKAEDVDRAIDGGRLAIAIGGDAAAIDAALPLLGGFAAKITRTGPIGTAQVVRQMGDLLALQTFAALAEALTTASAFGVEGGRLFDALAKEQGNSAAVGHHRLAEYLGTGDADADARTSIVEAGQRLKDAIQLAKGKHLSLSGADSTLKLIERAIEQGLGEKDLSGLLSVMGPEPKMPGRNRQQRA